tara:strand:+ start:101 stop:418 length:318 start_codon:yes stop_codon:yes gene_type:complete
MAGDCYQANGNFIITKMGDNDFKLCHGVALLASDKKPFGHCWVEKGGAILDFSNGKKIATTKKKYYELGGIPVSGYKNYLYTPAEAAKKMVETGHWGPWDSKPPR